MTLYMDLKYVCTETCISLNMYIDLHVDIHTWICVCVDQWMDVGRHMDIGRTAWMYVCMCTHIYIYIQKECYSW